MPAVSKGGRSNKLYMEKRNERHKKQKERGSIQSPNTLEKQPVVGEDGESAERPREVELEEAPTVDPGADSRPSDTSDSDSDEGWWYDRLIERSLVSNRYFMTGTRGNAGRASHGRLGMHGRPIALARWSLNAGSRNVRYAYSRRYHHSRADLSKCAPSSPGREDDARVADEEYSFINDDEFRLEFNVDP